MISKIQEWFENKGIHINRRAALLMVVLLVSILIFVITVPVLMSQRAMNKADDNFLLAPK